MPSDIYDLLVERVQGSQPLRRLLLGLNWSVAEVCAAGICFSPVDPPRTLAFPGTLAGRPVSELAPWVRSFDPCEAAVACAVINAVVNDDNDCIARSEPIANGAPTHLRVFDHFASRLEGAEVVVVGRYPGLETLWRGRNYTCIERRQTSGTLPDVAGEYLLPRADWVFITGSAIANKTLPRLLELSRGASVVLLGPSVPWMPEWADFGVNYLAGVTIRNVEKLWQIVAEGGGTRIFEDAVEYRLVSLS